MINQIICTVFVALLMGGNVWITINDLRYGLVTRKPVSILWLIAVILVWTLLTYKIWRG